MDGVRFDTRQTAYVLLLHNLPPETTASDIADWLWRETGLLVEPTDIRLRDYVSTQHATCVINRSSVANFIDRLVADRPFKGRQVCVRAERFQKESASCKN